MFMSSLLLMSFMLVSCSYNVFVASGSYCLFLVCLSGMSSILLYLVTKSFWYSCILLLVYMGGVYVLLLFVSIYSYKSFSKSNLSLAVFFWLLLISVMWSNIYIDESLLSFYPSSASEESLGLMSYNNWVSYLFMLSLLMVSIMMFSFLFNDKKSFMR